MTLTRFIYLTPTILGLKSDNPHSQMSIRSYPSILQVRHYLTSPSVVTPEYNSNYSNENYCFECKWKRGWIIYIQQRISLQTSIHLYNPTIRTYISKKDSRLFGIFVGVESSLLVWITGLIFLSIEEPLPTNILTPSFYMFYLVVVGITVFVSFTIIIIIILMLRPP